MPGLLNSEDLKRFWSKVDKTDDCWLWTDAPCKAGYGMLGVGGRKGVKLYAHRISYEIAKGEIPRGMEPDHLCRNRICVNPDHLEAVTRRVNLLRGETRAAINAAKTECLRGHALPPYQQGKRRQCQPCRNQLRRERRLCRPIC